MAYNIMRAGEAYSGNDETKLRRILDDWMALVLGTQEATRIIKKPYDGAVWPDDDKYPKTPWRV